MNIYFPLWVIIQYHYIYFTAQIVPVLVTGALSIGSCVLLTFFHVFFSTTLLSGTTRCSRYTLYVSFWGSSAIPPRSPGSFYLANGFENQDVGTKCASCYWGIIASRPSQLIKQGNIYVYTNLYVYQPNHMHKSINISVCNQLYLY